jgi:hypothetical protein
VFYLLTFLAGAVALSVGGRFVVSGDAVATAANILAREPSFRFGVITADLVTTACYVAVTALFYDLFRPVNRSLSLLAAFTSLVGCAIGAMSGVFHFAPLAVLGGAKYLSVFSTEQVQALALLFLKLHAEVQNISLLFFGFYCLLIGYLVFRSTFLPRILGVLMAFGGLGWLTGSFASFLSPPLASNLSPYILAPGILGEGALTLWLLVIGVNAQRWNEQAGETGTLARLS